MCVATGKNCLKHLAGLVIVALVSVCICVAVPGLQQHAYADSTLKAASTLKATAKKKTYTISPNSKPANAKILKARNYTKQSKHFWLLKSYMDLFEKQGGGTLILKKGTYNLPVSVSVPSNVKIIFKNGVKINKTTKTGKGGPKANTPLFQLVPPKKYSKKGSVKAYNGTKNVTFQGQGKVTFNMNNAKIGCAIIMAHNQNVKFSGITFKNAKQHFFELDASKNVTIEKCTFMNLKGAEKTVEAINLDTPDTKTGGFSFAWAKMDKTANQNVTIKNCTFKNVTRGIGTHKYSQKNGKNVMHQNIKILNNTFSGVAGVEGVVVPYNWQNVTISNNTFTGKGKAVKTFAIAALSVVNANISNNMISNFNTPITVRRGFASSGYADPAPISMSSANLAQLGTNKYKAGTVANGYAVVTASPYWNVSGPSVTTYALKSA